MKEKLEIQVNKNIMHSIDYSSVGHYSCNYVGSLCSLFDLCIFVVNFIIDVVGFELEFVVHRSLGHV